MPENRTQRTDHLGLLALMQSPAGGGPASSEQGWGFPYWNQVWLDAILAALHEAARDGVALLTAPDTGPTLELASSSGYLPSGLVLEVAQTWVDEWGRETDAGVVAEISTGDAIANPDTAPTLGTPSAAAVGFDGGLLEIAYSWIDEAAGETLPSPIAQVDVPYRTGNLKSEVLVTLPATPASADAAGAFIYARHRSGNWVRAAAISDDSETEATLDGTWISCFVALPLANSTGSGKAVDVTGIAAPADAALTRFYVRIQGESWTAGDRRLKLAGAHEWDPASVSYPLTYAGGVGELAPGYPPPVSQVKAIRKVDLATEVDGVLDEAMIDPAITRDSELGEVVEDLGELAEDVGDLEGALSGHTGDSDIHFTGTEKAECLLSAEEKTALTGGLETDLHMHPGSGGGLGASVLGLQLGLSLTRDEEFLRATYKALRDAQFREVLTMIHLVADYPSLQADLLTHRAAIETFESAALSADGVISGLVGSNGGGTTLNYSAGGALVNGTEYLAIDAGTVALTDNATNYVYVDTDGALKKQTSGWPATRHAKVCTAIVASGSIGTITNTVKVSQSAYDGANDQLKGVVATVATPIDITGSGTATVYAPGTKRRLADHFTPGANYSDYLLTVRIATPGQRDFTIQLQSDNGGVPSGTVLDSQTVSDNNNTEHDLALTDINYPLVSGTKYWIVYGYDATTNENYTVGKAASGSYWSSDDGGAWAEQATGDLELKLSVNVSTETVWQSKLLASDLADPITRIIGTLRGVAVDNGSAWDDDLYAAVLEARTQDTGDWVEVPADEELLPSDDADQLEIRCRLTSLSTARYPVVDGLGVLFEQ